MTEDEGRIRKCLEENAEKIAPVASSGLAVFGILGDPNFFSTFSRLCAVIAAKHPDIELQDRTGDQLDHRVCSRCRVPVNSGFSVSDGTDDGSRVILKVRRPQETAAELRAEGYRDFVLVERMYFPEMKVYRNDELPAESDYMSVMYARK